MHVLKRKPSTKLRIQDEYQIIGFISSGTYGRVYKANRINHEQLYAIKRFKKDSKDGDNTVNGISQSAVREMALCAELRHENVIPFVETILQDHSIFMIFEYCEHDLLQMISHHVNPPDGKKVTPIPAFTLQSIVYQLLQGVNYLHTNWVLHRDLKPANIMVTSTGQIKIGDLGLARIFREPIKTLYEVDKVVVTIWYRAPELLIGAKHYTPAIDLWAVGCIFGELLGLRPMFKGDEVKMDNRKAIPFQKNQLQKILDIMGIPEKQQWPLAEAHNDYQQFKQCTSESKKGLKFGSLAQWYRHTLSFSGYDGDSSPGEQGLQVLTGLLTYDDHGRLSAKQALEYSYFEKCRQLQDQNCFHQSNVTYPKRKITEDDPGTGLTGIKKLLRLRRSARTLQYSARAAPSDTGSPWTFDAPDLHGSFRTEEKNSSGIIVFGNWKFRSQHRSFDWLRWLHHHGQSDLADKDACLDTPPSPLESEDPRFKVQENVDSSGACPKLRDRASLDTVRKHWLNKQLERGSVPPCSSLPRCSSRSLINEAVLNIRSGKYNPNQGCRRYSLSGRFEHHPIVFMQSEITIGDEPEEEGENEEEQESEEGDEAEEDDENEDFGYPLDRTSSRADPPPPRSASRARYRSPPPSRSSGLWRDLSPGSQLEEARELMPVLPSLGPPPDPSQTRVTPQEAARRRLPPGPHSLSRQVQRSPEREASEPQESPAVGTQNLTPGTSAAGTENPFPQQSPERTPENAPEGTSQHAPEGTSQQAPEQTSEQEGAGRAGTSSDLSDDIYLITDSAKMTEILKRTERKERNLERRDLENLRKIMVINSVREWAEQNLERGVREEQDPQGQNIAEAESRRQAALEEVRRRFWEIPCVSEGSEQNIFTDDLNSTVDSQDESNDLKQRRPSVGFTHSSFRENFESGMDESGRAKTPIEDLERTVSIMEGTEPASQQQDPQEDSDRLQERRSSVILDRSSIRENVDSEVRESGRTKTPLEDHARTLSIIEGMDPPPQQGCPQQESNSLQRTRPSTGQTRSTSEEFFDNVSGESEGENGTRRGVPRMPSIVEAMNAPPPQENFEESNRSPSRPPGTSRLQPTNKGNPDDEAQESERGHGMVGGSEPRRLENHPMDTPPQQESQETGPRDRLSLTQRLKRFKLWTGKGKDGREENDPPPQSPDDEQAARPEATSEPQALVGKGKGKAKAKPQDSTKGSSFHRAWYGQGIERKNEDAKRLAALFSSAPASFGKGESSQNPGSPDFGSGGRAMGNASAGPVTRLPGNLAPSTTPIQPPTSGADGAVDERRRHFEQRDGGQRGGRQQRSSESERARSHSSGSSGSLERSRD